MSLLVLVGLLLVLIGVLAAKAVRRRAGAVAGFGAGLCGLALLVGARGAALPVPIGLAGGGGALQLDGLSALFLLLSFLVAAFAEAEPLCLAATCLAMLAGDLVLLAAAAALALLALPPHGLRRRPGRLRTLAAGGLVGACALLGGLAAPAGALLPETGFSLVRDGFAAPGRPEAAVLLPVLVVLGVAPPLGLWPLAAWHRRLCETAPPWAAALASLLGLFLLLRLLPDLAGSAPAAGWGCGLAALGLVSALAAAAGALRAASLRGAVARLLAVQNGLAVLGVGLCLLARADDLAGLAATALDAVLLLLPTQVLAGLALLTLAAGIEEEAGASLLARLGGLVQSMPRATALAAVAVAMLAFLPPIGGFPALWLLLQSALAMARAGGAAPVPALLAVMAAAVAVALSGLAWMRLVAVAGLGRPRTPRGAAAQEIGGRLGRTVAAMLVLPALTGLLPGVLAAPAAVGRRRARGRGGRRSAAAAAPRGARRRCHAVAAGSGRAAAVGGRRMPAARAAPGGAAGAARPGLGGRDRAAAALAAVRRSSHPDRPGDAGADGRVAGRAAGLADPVPDASAAAAGDAGRTRGGRRVAAGALAATRRGAGAGAAGRAAGRAAGVPWRMTLGELLLGVLALLLHLALSVAAAPVLGALVDRVAAMPMDRPRPRASGAALAAALRRPWRRLAWLMAKEPVLAENASAVGGMAPILAVAVTLAAAALVPSFLRGMPTGGLADLPAILALLGLAGLILLLGSLDIGAAGPGLAAMAAPGAALPALPGLVLAVAGLWLAAGGTGLEVLLAAHDGGAPGRSAARLLATGALGLAALAAGGGEDGPSRELAGPDLALFGLQSDLRRLVWIELVTALAWPGSLATVHPNPLHWPLGWPLDWLLDWPLGLLLWAVRVAAGGVVLGAARGWLAVPGVPRRLARASAALGVLAPLLLLAGRAAA